MRSRSLVPLVLLLLIILFHLQGCNGEADDASAHPLFQNWELRELLPEGRFDALAYLGNETVLIGSREPNPGHIFRSTDLGKTWEEIPEITRDEITGLASGGEGRAYMLTGKSHFYRSDDDGQSWTHLGRISHNQSYHWFKLSYGLHVTDKGTLLVADTAESGGHIFRSTDEGESWESLGPVAEHALYRFESTADGILVNGWEGAVYKSTDDGKSWEKTAQLSEDALYATEYMGDGINLQGTASGRVFRSKDRGHTWTDVGLQSEITDDFVRLGDHIVVLTTGADASNPLYLSEDTGKTWENIGILNPEIPEDWLDHAIYIERPDRYILIGGSNKGYAVRAEVRR